MGLNRLTGLSLGQTEKRNENNLDEGYRINKDAELGAVQLWGTGNSKALQKWKGRLGSDSVEPQISCFGLYSDEMGMFAG